MKYKSIAIITARAGSKRFINKNISLLLGKPLIYWTIKEAIDSKCFDEVMVSTDCDKIAKVAKKYGASVPFLRPLKYAKDDTSSAETLINVINTYKHLGKEFNYVALLQPTSPLRNKKDIIKSFKLLKKKKSKAIISVCEAEHSPLWSNTLPKTLSMSNFILSVNKNKNTQQLSTNYRLNGAIYLCETKELLKQRTLLLKKRIYAYIMPQNRSIDIDTKEDLIFAEILLKRDI